MSASHSEDDIRLDVRVGRPGSSGKPETDTPFRIVILGDFGGRNSRGIVRNREELTSLCPRSVDRDNVDQLMSRLDICISLPEAGDIRFRELEGFHPDRLFQELPLFDKIRQAEQQLRSLPSGVTLVRERKPPTPAPDLGTGSLLDRAAEETEREITGERGREDPLQNWVDDQVRPHLLPKADQRIEELRSVVASTAAAQMRALLHYPSFQRLESMWRTLHQLVRRLETGTELKVYLIDLSKQELTADLSVGDDPRDSAVFRLISELSEEALLAVLLGAYDFGATNADIQLLARLGTLAAGVGAPLISDADPSLVGCRSFAETPSVSDWSREPNPAWQALRCLPVARWIGLALPRVLLRLPYGSSTDACELIPFEEMEGTPEHGRYLWGSAAVACGGLLAESFADRGWDFRPGDHRDLTELPLHAYVAEGEDRLQSPAEAWLGENAVERALEQGLMPLMARRNTDTVRVVRFQSVADPPAPLSGRWNQES